MELHKLDIMVGIPKNRLKIKGVIRYGTYKMPRLWKTDFR